MKRKSLFLFLLLLLGAPGAWAQSAYYSYSNISHTYGSNSSMYTGNSDRFPERLFDNNLDTKYCVVFTNDTWAGYLSVTFESNDLIIPSKYVIYTGDDTQSNPGRNPKNWHIDAKVNESDNWTTIHTVTNAGLPNTNKTSVEYTISGVTTAYKYFRFYITDIVSGSTFQLQDFHFIATVSGGGGDDNCDLSENFDGVTGTSYSTAGSMPSGWYSYTTATGTNIVAPHVVSGSSYNYYHSASQSLGMESGTNANNTAYAVMPATAGGKAYSSLSFYYKQESTNSGYGTLSVGYVMAQTATGCSNFVRVQDITPSTTLHEETVDVSSIPSNAYLAFRWIVTSGSYYACCIDDVCLQLEDASSCLVPTLEEVDPQTIYEDQVSLRWIINGTETRWMLQYSTDASFTNATSVDITNGLPILILHDLTPATTYYVRVKAICDTNDESGWSNIITFRTTCGSITSFPWIENFESYAAGNFNDPCWVNEHISGSGTSLFKVYTSTNGTNSTHQLQLPDQSNGTLTKLRLPEMNLPNDNYMFTIDVYRTSSYPNYTTEGISVFASTNGEIENATLLAFIPRVYSVENETGEVTIPAEATSNSWYTYELPIGISGTCYIIIRGENLYGASTYMDNFIVSEIPSCLKPINLAVNEIGSRTAVVSWDARGTETSWQLCLNGDEDNLIDVSINPYNLTGLTPETAYTIKVRANCGDIDGVSEWTSEESFTTAIACPAPTDLNVTNITGHEATLNWTGSSDNNNVRYRTTGLDNIEEEFSNSSIPSGWTRYSGLVDNVLAGTAELTTTTSGWNSTSYALGSYNMKVNIYGTSCRYWLVTPEVHLADGLPLNFDLALTDYNNSDPIENVGNQADDRFVVLIYVNGAWTVLREWNNSGSSYVYDAISSTGENVSINLSAYNGHTVKIAFYGESTTSGGDNDLHIDNVTVGVPIAPGEWQTVTTNEASVTLTGLMSETLYEAQIQSNCGDDGLSSWTDLVTFTTDVACPAPVNMTVSDITAHGATVSWEKMATQATGDITYNYTWVEHGGTPDWTLNGGMSAFDRWYDSSQVPHAFAFGLDPETTYDFYVRRNCGEEGYSAEMMVSFTTTVACPVPSDITVSDITGHEAMVAWTGSSESYTVKYRTAAYMNGVDEGFNESSTPSNWTQYTGLFNETTGTATLSSGSRWYFGNSNGVFDLHARTNVYSTYQAWLVTPSLTVSNGFSLSFDVALTKYSGTLQPVDPAQQLDDKFIVLISTDNKATWTILRKWDNAGSAYVYNDIACSATGENVILDLSAYSGQTAYIAFYGESTAAGGDNNLHIDNVVVGYPIPAGEWQTITLEDTIVALNGLAPETLYEVVIQGDCGEEGLSAESEPVTFTTDISCPAPTPLDATDITSNSAVLHWTGNAESYNVSYYKAYFFDSFESEEDFHNQWTVYKVGDDGSTEWIVANPSESSSDLNAHSGITVVSSESYPEILTDNWLISPQITLPNQATLKFWIMRSTYDDAQDEYEVLLSTTGNAIEDFTVIKGKVAANSEWTEVSINLSAYDGQQCYIAIRHEFTDGFFLMVDDFGIFGWSEPIATTENSLLIEDLLPETEYQWKVQANCGEVDGSSQWSIVDSFTTLLACPVPFDLIVSEITANGATIAWTGYNDSYNVWVGQLEMASTNYDFEDNTISADFTNSTSYPWATTSNDKHSGTYSVKSGGTGTNSMTSDLKLEVTVENDAILSFWAKVSSESNWDYGRFLIDGTQQLQISGTSHIWTQYSYELEAGTHTLIWRYYKDSSNSHGDDCFYVDDITIESDVVSTEMNYTATESPLLLNDATNILPQTTYMVKIKGICGDEETEYSESITFTTLDENTKIFVFEGEWSNGDNWVPVGVPTIDENVILRAEATVFDVAEANNITIDDAGSLTIEDGGQLKTNSDVTATMKKFIIGYGTDYVETNNGYYLMTLPTAAPISAADAGLLTEESDYDLYSWDRTATDEEWQNNHDGIDLQNGVGFLYANRDDMEMLFTATLRNSSEPVVVTPAYDEVEHGGWNLCGNPFPCEAYITTNAEGMAFYRLVDNQLELIEGAIAPLEAFFVKATAAGQTFTISREAPAK